MAYKNIRAKNPCPLATFDALLSTAPRGITEWHRKHRPKVLLPTEPKNLYGSIDENILVGEKEQEFFRGDALSSLFSNKRRYVVGLVTID
ncbi:MAG: hypothetical protein NTY76_02095 [Candidatus Omnitrophica bacterium]|nr:hypothetical protein [Candidatus Omnitrophota bacterium]